MSYFEGEKLRPEQLSVSLMSYLEGKKLRPEQLSVSLMSYLEGKKLRLITLTPGCRREETERSQGKEEVT